MFKSILLNGVSNGTRMGSRWLLNLLLVGTMPVAQYGIFSTDFALMSVVTVIIAYGAPTLMLQVKDSSRAWPELNTSLAVSLLLFAIGLVVAALVGFVAARSVVAPVTLAFCFALNYLVSFFLKTNYRFATDLLYCAISTGLIVSVAIVARLYPLEPTTILWLLAIAVVIPAALTYGWFLRGRGGTPSLSGAREQSRLVLPALAGRLPFAGNDLYSVLLATAPVLFLGYLSTKQDAGIFKALFTLVTPAMLASTAIVQVYLPRLARIGALERFRASALRLLLVNTGLGLVLAGAFLALGSLMVHKLYGKQAPELWEHREIFFILVGALPFWYVKGVCEAILTASGRQRLRARIVRDVSVLLCLALIGTMRWHVEWAACAYSVAIAAAALWNLGCALRGIPLENFRRTTVTHP